MLTEVKATVQYVGELVLPLPPAEDDVLEIRNIDGLGPVKASVSTSSYGNIDGVTFTGAGVADRNIVITLGPRPDYDDWSVEKIRDFAYKYFMPKLEILLTFQTTEKPPVQISGIVESCEPVIFGKDNEIQVSIICPFPHFMTVGTIELEGLASDSLVPDFLYEGTVPVGINVWITQGGDDDDLPTDSITVETHTPFFPDFATFTVNSSPSDTAGVEINSVPGDKYVRLVRDPDDYDSLLSVVDEPKIWPMLTPGSTHFKVSQVGPDPVAWRLQYRALYGGL